MCGIGWNDFNTKVRVRCVVGWNEFKTKVGVRCAVYGGMNLKPRSGSDVLGWDVF